MTTDSAVGGRLLTWSTSIFVQLELTKRYRGSPICSIYVFRTTTSRSSTYDVTKLYCATLTEIDHLLHCETKIRCLWANDCLELDFLALKFHSVWEFSEMHFRDWNETGFHRSCSLSFHWMCDHKVLGQRTVWNSSYPANSSPCFMSGGNAIHSICHSATKMKMTTNIFPSKFLINFEDLVEMVLRICILFVVGLDSALGSVFPELGSA